MNKVLGKASNIAGWLVIVASILLYAFVNFLVFKIPDDKTFIEIIFSFGTIITTLLVISLNISIKLSTQSVALQYVISQDEFKLANKTNNEIINDAVEHFKELAEYVANYNKEQLDATRRAYLFDLGKTSYQELSRKQKRYYNRRIKYDKISLKGFIKPILSLGKSKDNTTTFDVNYNVDTAKIKGILIPIINGLLMSAFAINMFFAMVDKPLEALLQLFVVILGLVINFVMTFVPIIFRFLQVIPNIVQDKRSLYNNFKGKNNFIPLYEVKKEDTNKVEIKAKISNN